MRIKRLTFLLLMASNAAFSQRNGDDDSKGTFSCAGSGSKCDGDFITNGATFCDGEGVKCCSMPLYCVAGVCSANNVDSECTSDADCRATYYGTGLAVCDNETKRCRTQYNAGDTCASSANCYGGMTCSSTKCVGFEEGHECTPLRNGTEATGLTGYVCGKGLYCLDGNCTQQGSAGDECLGDESCANGLVCNNYKCVKRYSVADDQECDNNYACGLKSVCYSGKCTKGVAYNFMSCSEDSDCVIDGVSGVCQEQANIFTGKRMCVFHDGLSISCRKKEKKLFACMEKNGCAPVPSSDGNTCSQTKCSSKLLDYFACEQNCKRFRQTYGSKCATGTILNYCPTMATWLKIFLVFAALLVVITVLFVVYGIHVHKTKNLAYSEISK